MIYTSDEIEKRVRLILAAHLGEQHLSSPAEALLSPDEYGIDSIDLLEILVELETEFDIEFDDMQLSGNVMRSISELVGNILEKLVVQERGTE